jgi:hypothetical protein
MELSTISLHQMVQRFDIGAAYVHAGATSDSFQTLQDLDAAGIIFSFRFGFFSHETFLFTLNGQNPTICCLKNGSVSGC